MNISGKIIGDFAGLRFTYTASNGTRMAYALIKSKGDKDKIAAQFGDDFAAFVFHGLTASGGGEDEGEAGVRSQYSEIKPKGICPFSEIKIVGHKIDAQPVIKGVMPVDNEMAVVVSMEIPIDVTKGAEKLAGDLVSKFGEVIEIEVDPNQQELDFEGGGGGKNKRRTVMSHGAFNNPKPVPVGASAPA